MPNKKDKASKKKEPVIAASKEEKVDERVIDGFVVKKNKNSILLDTKKGEVVVKIDKETEYAVMKLKLANRKSTEVKVGWKDLKKDDPVSVVVAVDSLSKSALRVRIIEVS